MTNLFLSPTTEQPCQVHDWPPERMAHRLILEARRRQSEGGLRVCTDCLRRARPSVKPAPSVPPSRQELFEAAEAHAANRALEVFAEVLREELKKLGCRNIMEVLGRGDHVHYAFFTGEHEGVVRYSFVFDDGPAAVAAVRDRIQADGGLVDG